MREHLENALRRYFVRPFALSLGSHLTPNAVTLFGCSMGIAAGIAIAFSHFGWGIALLLISGYLDLVDGAIARMRGSSTPLGAALDITADRAVESSVVIGLALSQPDVPAIFPLGMLAAILICVTSFLVVGIFAEKRGEKAFHYSRGIIERGEAFCFFVAMCLFPSLFRPLAGIFTLLVLTTALIRLREFQRAEGSRNCRNGE